MKYALSWMCVAVLAAPAWADEKTAQTPESRAKAFVESLAKEDFDAAAKTFDDTVAKALPVEKLRGLWQAVTTQAGAFQKPLGTRAQKKPPYDVVIVACRFAKAELDVRVVLDAKGRVAGLQFLPAQSEANYPPPAYADKSSFAEQAVTVGAGEWALPGTLTLPKGDGPFPAAVLVHGSGPQDRDETIGLVKPLRDLAWGLASCGVAVLRYEKRTRQHDLKFAKVKEYTVNEETIDDGLAAAALLRQTGKIDPARVYWVGHSLGAMLAPRAGLRDPKLAGLVLLAAPGRPLEDVILEQTERGLKAKPGPEETKLLEQLAATARKVKDGAVKPDTPAGELVGAPGAYWLDLRGYRPQVDAAKLALPILVLQGERDVQVTMTDFGLWKEAAGGRTNVTLKSYPRLNHCFVEEADGDPPSKYDKPGNVAKPVVDDIAAWVKKK